MPSLPALRIIWVGFLLFVLGCTWFGDRMARPFPGTFTSQHWVCIGGAIWALLIALGLAGKVRRVAKQRAARGNLQAAGKSWQLSMILAWASANSIALFGFVAAVFGSPRWFVAAFDIVGALLLLSHLPARPSFLPAESQQPIGAPPEWEVKGPR